MKGRKRKATESAKTSRSKSKRRKTIDSSVSAIKDNQHHRENQRVRDVAIQQFLEDIMMQ